MSEKITSVHIPLMKLLDLFSNFWAGLRGYNRALDIAIKEAIYAFYLIMITKSPPLFPV